MAAVVHASIAAAHAGIVVAHASIAVIDASIDLRPARLDHRLADVDVVRASPDFARGDVFIGRSSDRAVRVRLISCYAANCRPHDVQNAAPRSVTGVPQLPQAPGRNEPQVEQ